MIRTTICLLIGASWLMLGPQFVFARGCGGAHAGGGYHASGPAGGSRSGGYSAGSHYASGPEGSAAMRGGASYHSYQGAHGGSVEHGTAAVQGAGVGPGGAAAGGRAVSGTEITTPKGNTYTHESSAGRGVVAGPGGVEAGRYGETGGAYHGANGSSYARGAAGYGHTALPTDAGYGAARVGAGSAAYTGFHQTEAAGAGIYAARGAAVRSGYNGYGMYGAGWHAANPGAWTAAGWAAGQAWTPATWSGVGAALGWGAVRPVGYNYGDTVTYQDNQVYYGDQPVATAEQYYQQASALAQAAPAADAKADEWFPLGVFGLVQKEQSEPQFVMQLAVNKSGAIGGNYTDTIAGTNSVIQGAVDKKTQRAAWTVGKNTTTVCETGLYNLTQDEAPALIHIGKDKTQQWLLVRLKQPQQ